MKGNFLKRLITGCIAAWMLAGTVQAASWWNNDWTVRKKITVDTSPAGAGISDSIGNTVLLLRLHDTDFPASAKDDGSDIRFVTSDDKTVLPFQIEKYDSLVGEAFVWVKVPDVKTGGQTSIWMYYGNGSNNAGKVEDAKNTYDSDTVLVYHFGEKGAPASDSSAQGNNAQNPGTSVDGSMIGVGVRFDGKGTVTVADSASLGWTGGGSMTWSAWIKPTALQPNQVIFSRRDGSNSFVIGIDNGVPYVEASGAGRSQGGSAPLAANSWHHLAVATETSAIRVYVDGEVYATLSAGLPAMTGPLTIGGDSASNSTGFTGEMDELEISKASRSAGFIKFAAISQGSDKVDKLLKIAPEEQPTNWLSWLNNGYFGIIVKSLTLDGWVVIGILLVMSAISWFVMISKASYLNATTKGNAIFMREWRHIASDLTVLDDIDADQMKTLGGRFDKKAQRALRSAGVYRIYHIGAEEIRHRLEADKAAGGDRLLGARSIQAIRASLDTGLVRETQRLNSQMVLLTIAISGGPFLGLLGTVVGVMITFAAVAAAGDVNVNAIAPGIAAALLATVAGLAVAIPSLFGYNYLLSRVKDATSDMHVFIDEFVSRMAEFYEGGSPSPSPAAPVLVAKED